jgi:hypothetical protein
MKTRLPFATMTLALLVAGPASASIISASSQALKSRGAERADYLDVTTAQNELNSSLHGMTDAVVPADLSAGSLQSNATGGFVIQSPSTSGGLDANSVGRFSPQGGQRFGGNSGGYSFNSRGARWAPGPGDKGKKGGNNVGGDHRRRRGSNSGPQAAPEPSTWMLLATGLLMLGGYAILRRRTATSA